MLTLPELLIRVSLFQAIQHLERVLDGKSYLDLTGK